MKRIELLFFILIFYFVVFFLPKEGDVFSAIVFFVFTIFSIILISRIKKRIRVVLLLAFVLRIFAALISFYGIFPLEGSGQDAIVFSREAENMVQSGIIGMILNFGYYTLNFYSYLIAWMYLIFGDHIVIPICFNTLLGVGIIYRIYQITSLLFNSKVGYLTAKFSAIIPWLIIFSATLLREAFLTFFIISSVFYFINYYFSGRIINSIKSIIYILFAVLLHGGVIFTAFLTMIILFYIAFTKHKSSQFLMNIFIGSFIMIFFGLAILSGKIQIYKLSSLQNKENSTEVKEYFQKKSGFAKESSKKTYRDRIYLETASDYVISFPKVVVPFLFKPYLWDIMKWRYPIHYFHSILMLFLFYFLTKNFRSILNNRLLFYLFIIYSFSTIVFAYGTAQINASIRHNYKMLPLLLCLLGDYISKIMIRLKLQ